MADDPKALTTSSSTPPAPQEPRKEEGEELRMTFTEHLGELRMRIIKSFWALLIGFALCYTLSNQIFNLLQYPLRSAGLGTDTTSIKELAPVQPVVPATLPPAVDGVELPPEWQQAFGDISARVAALEAQVIKKKTEVPWTALSPIEPIVVQVKLGLYAGVLLALPFILWQMCAFIFPGLHRSERQVVQVLLVGCSLLGIAGMAVAYFGVFPLVLPYLILWLPDGVMMQLRMNETVTIILYGLLGFAIAFQFPMVVLILVYLDLLSPATLKQYRKLAVVGIAFASAILTPPDPISMGIMMLPLLVLYECSIWMSYLIVYKRKKREAQDASS